MLSFESFPYSMSICQTQNSLNTSHIFLNVSQSDSSQISPSNSFKLAAIFDRFDVFGPLPWNNTSSRQKTINKDLQLTVILILSSLSLFLFCSFWVFFFIYLGLYVNTQRTNMLLAPQPFLNCILLKSQAPLIALHRATKQSLPLYNSFLKANSHLWSIWNYLCTLKEKHLRKG